MCCWASRAAGQWPRRYGTSAMTVCSRPTSAAFSRLAVWLYSNRSHQWRATYSGRTTIVDRRLLVGRPGLVEDVEVGDDRRDDRPVRRLDDDQRHVRQLALPARAQRRRRRRGRRSRRRPGRRGASERPKLTAWTTARLMPLTGMITRCSRCGPGRTPSSRTAQLGLLRLVLAVDERHDRDQDRDEDEDEPGAVGELDRGDDDRHDPGERSRRRR